MGEFEFEKGEILTNLTLIEDHAEKFPCPYCLEKHLSKIIGYADEVALGEKNMEMQKLAEEARKWRRNIQGAKEHSHNNSMPRKYEPYGLTMQEKKDKILVHGKCMPKSNARYCRLVRCIQKVEKQGGVNAVAVCRASIYKGGE